MQYTYDKDSHNRHKRETIDTQRLASQLTAAQINSANMLMDAYQKLNNRLCSFFSIIHGQWLSFDGGQGTTLLARDLLNTSLVQARWASDNILQVWSCFPIPIENITIVPSPDQQCYHKIPVNVSLHLTRSMGEFQGFLEPRTNIITQTSHTGPCEIYLKSSFSLGGKLMILDQHTGQISTGTVEKLIPGQIPPLGAFSPSYTIFHDLKLKNFSDEQTRFFELLNTFQLSRTLDIRSAIVHGESLGPFGGHPYDRSFSFELPWQSIFEYIIRLWVVGYVFIGTAMKLYRLYQAVKWLLSHYKQIQKQRNKGIQETSPSEDSSGSEKKRRRNRRKRKNKAKEQETKI